MVARGANRGPGSSQGFFTALGIVVGGIFAYYKFFRQGEHDPKLQPAVTGGTVIHEGTIYVVVTATVHNSGNVTVRLDLGACVLEVFTTVAGGPAWRFRHGDDVFLEHDLVQPGETIEDQIWLEIPHQDEVGLSLDLTVSDTEDNSWVTTEIIQILPKDDGKSRPVGRQ